MDDSVPRPPVPTRGAVVAVLVVGLVPWSVLWGRSDTVLVMAWGLFDPSNIHLHSLYTLLTESWPSYWLLPHSLRVWPVGTGLYGLALASAGSGLVFQREDPRVTGGLLVLAGIAALWVTIGIAVMTGGGTVAVPVGALALWLVAWQWYGPALRHMV